MLAACILMWIHLRFDYFSGWVLNQICWSPIFKINVFNNAFPPEAVAALLVRSQQLELSQISSPDALHLENTLPSSAFWRRSGSHLHAVLLLDGISAKFRFQRKMGLSPKVHNYALIHSAVGEQSMFCPGAGSRKFRKNHPNFKTRAIQSQSSIG